MLVVFEKKIGISEYLSLREVFIGRFFDIILYMTITFLVIMASNYHDLIIECFRSNIGYFEPKIGFPINNTISEVYHEKGEIDIIVKGFENEIGLIEVKSNSCVTDKFRTKQLHSYRKYDPTASIYLLVGTKEESLILDDFHIRMYHLGSWFV